MVLALLLPQCIQLVVGRAPGPIFFRVGPPGKLQATSPQAPKLDRFRVLGYYKI